METGPVGNLAGLFIYPNPLPGNETSCFPFYNPEGIVAGNWEQGIPDQGISVTQLDYFVGNYNVSSQQKKIQKDDCLDGIQTHRIPSPGFTEKRCRFSQSSWKLDIEDSKMTIEIR